MFNLPLRELVRGLVRERVGVWLYVCTNVGARVREGERGNASACVGDKLICSISVCLRVFVREWVQVDVAERAYECECALGDVSACVGDRVSEWVGRKKADCKIIKYNSTKEEKWSKHYLLLGQTYEKYWFQELTHTAPDGCDDEHRRRRLLPHPSETETSSTSKIINRSSDLINIFFAMTI